MHSHNAKVGVILLNWNGEELTIPCIESLLAGETRPWKIVVFDNASTDGSPERIKERFPCIDLLKSPSNLGFTGGNNEAMRYLLRLGAEYIWVLNNDTVVAPDCLGRLVEEMDGDPTLAATTAKIYFETPPNLLWYAGARSRSYRMQIRHRGLREPDSGRYDQACDVSFLSGCCMLIRRNALSQTGIFNSRYFGYFEDAEWCLRALKKGWRLRYIPSARLWHKQHATTKKLFKSGHSSKAPPFQEHLQARNIIWLTRAHAGRRLLLALPCELGYRLKRAAGLLLLGRWQSALAIVKGLIHGLFCSYESPQSQAETDCLFEVIRAGTVKDD